MLAAMNELLTPEQIVDADRLCGVAEATLIENAGRAVAAEICRRFGARKTIVLCGPGNNGKDGAVVARLLKSWGWPVEISDNIKGAELIIDALYGAGLNRDFPTELADKINRAGVPVISIDVPSGLDGNTGNPRGACVKADLTITFFRKKPAHVLQPGRNLCGEVVVLDIGIPQTVLEKIKPRFFENGKPNLPAIEAAGHKFDRGHAIVVSGGKFNTGASRLAAQSALRIGAGLATIAGKAEALLVHANHVTAVMLAEIVTANQLQNFLNDDRKTAVCIGPAAGVGEPTRQLAMAILKSQAHAVVDADALTSFQNASSELFAMIRAKKSGAVVLTPHEGEFTRLFGETHGSKIERAITAAKLSGAIVILKGSDTVIAQPDGTATVNTNAPASLATAGSGDVLAGILTGLLAQKMPPYEAACAAVWLHGNLGAELANEHFTAEDLVRRIAVAP